MNEKIYQIYDRIFKRIFALSNLAIINLINGLFNTNYPPDAHIEYPNKEFVSMHLAKRFADVFLIIEGVTYHLEAQMTDDEAIIVRIFEYGFHYSIDSRTDNTVLRFPEPIVIYLDTGSSAPKISTLTLDFGTQGTFSYQVKNFLYQEHEVSELNQKKMIILIPFQLLKLRKIIQKSPTKENFAALQKLIQDDILNSIKTNVQVGNITLDDANQLRELTIQLYDHIYKHYEDIGGHEDMKPLLDGAMELPLDKYRIRIDELEKKIEAANQEKDALAQENDSLAQEKDSLAQEKDSLAQENKRLQELLKQAGLHL